jgi:hypothetical protein
MLAITARCMVRTGHGLANSNKRMRFFRAGKWQSISCDPSGRCRGDLLAVSVPYTLIGLQDNCSLEFPLFARPHGKSRRTGYRRAMHYARNVGFANFYGNTETVRRLLESIRSSFGRQGWAEGGGQVHAGPDAGRRLRFFEAAQLMA